MKRMALALVAGIGTVISIAAAEKGSAMGLYEGIWTAPNGKKGRVTAQIRPVGQGKYDGFVAMYRAKAFEGALKLSSISSGEIIKFAAAAAKSPDGSLTPPMEAACEWSGGRLSGAFKGDFGEGKFEAEPVGHQSPTLGAKPPAKGIVIFDGKATNQWKDFRWKITPEGTMIAGGGDIHTVEKLANFLLHVEFRTPLMPDAQGQERGNSGVYLQSKYEVQVLDSFGLFPLQNNDCSGIYSLKAPELNMCLPPGQWQTYDITFVQGNAARKENPTITVVFNGVTVIDKFEVPSEVVAQGTTAGDADGGFLKLQDHGNPVEYRNIWVEPFFTADRK